MKKITLILWVLLTGAAALAQDDLGVFQQVLVRDGTVYVVTSKGSLQFRQFPNELLQTTFEANGYAGEQVSNAVVQQPEAAPRILRDDAELLQLGAGTLVVNIHKQPVQVFIGANGRGASFTGYRQADGHHELLFRIAPGEPFFGTGSRSLPLNRNGYRVELNNNPWYGYSTDADNLNYSLPVLLSGRGYGLFFDNPSRGYFDIGKAAANELRVGLRAGKLQFYTFIGRNPATLIERFTSLVGRMPLPPRWALGNFMSRFGYKTQDEVMEIAGRMKKEGFPFDAVIIDLFWFGDGVHGAWNMGNLDWDRKRFPRPEEMIRQLADQQIKTILITEPFVLAESFNYLSTQQEKLHAVNQQGDTVGIKEFYFGHAGLLDIFQQKTKDWFWSKYDAQIQKGVAGWWGDLGEPEKHPDYLYHNLKDQGHDRLFSADEVHNLYGHLWSQMLFEKYAQHYPNQRLFHLNRSGYAGTWRYGSFPWSGDVDRSWKGLRAQLPVMMGTGLSGIPTMHSDAGGFAMGQRDPELYRRWLQMAVFSPIFRPHGSVAAPEANAPSIESEPVFYDEPDKSILRSTIELRYRLMPYVYNLARESARNGSPFVRPLFYTDTSDRELFNATDQYYFGPHLLVAPVLEPGATTRRLYLPRGDWYDFHRPTERLQGGRWMEVPTEAATIPVFVKAGAVVPMKPVFENTGSYPAGKWIFHYYPAAGDSYNSFYEDDGQATDALEKNKYEEIRVKTTRKGRRTRVEISATGSYPGQPEKRVVDLWIHGVGNPRLVNVNNSRTSNFSREGNSIRVSGLNWNGQSLRVELRQ